MHKSLKDQIKQSRRFASPEQAALLGVRMLASRLLTPWEQFLKADSDLSTGQFNVLRILRGSHPAPLTCGEIGERTIARDPDITRLVDRLSARGLVSRSRSEKDRRVVDVHITAAGLKLLKHLDPHALAMPIALLGHVSKSKLKQLALLLEDVMDGLGTYPPPRS